MRPTTTVNTPYLSHKLEQAAEKISEVAKELHEHDEFVVEPSREVQMATAARDELLIAIAYSLETLMGAATDPRDSDLEMTKNVRTILRDKRRQFEDVRAAR